MHPNKFAMAWTCFAILMLASCQESDKSTKIKVDASGYVPPKIDLSKIVLPNGFPTDIPLYKVGWIAEQEDNELDQTKDEYGSVTWDTAATVTEVRDFYVGKFNEHKLEPITNQETSIPGENYMVRYFDEKLGKLIVFSCGQRNESDTVKCFLRSFSCTAEDFNKFKNDKPK